MAASDFVDDNERNYMAIFDFVDDDNNDSSYHQNPL